MSKAKTYITMNAINKKIYFFGLEPFMAMMVFIVTVILVIIFQLYSLIFLIPLGILGTKLSKESRKGIPNYIDSLLLSFTVKRNFNDSDFLMNKLKKPRNN